MMQGPGMENGRQKGVAMCVLLCTLAMYEVHRQMRVLHGLDVPEMMTKRKGTEAATFVTTMVDPLSADVPLFLHKPVAPTMTAATGTEREPLSVVPLPLPLPLSELDLAINRRVRRLHQFDPSTADFLAPVATGGEREREPLPSVRYLPAEGHDPVPGQVVRTVMRGPNADGCVATSRFRLDTSSFAHHWILQALGGGTDEPGSSSAGTLGRGGDELYVTYRDAENKTPSPDAVARIVDGADGTYRLYFLRSRSPLLRTVSAHDEYPRRSGRGTLSVRLITTCGASTVEPPGKSTWGIDGGGEDSAIDRSGYVGTVYEVEVDEPPLGTLTVAPASHPELDLYGLVIPYGDSVMDGFFGLSEGGGRRSNLLATDKSGAPLNTDTIDGLDDEDDERHQHDARHHKFLPQLRKTVAMARSEPDFVSDEQTVLVLGSCAWDVTAHHTKTSLGNQYHFFSFFEMEDHLRAVRTLIETARHEFPDFADIYWLGCAAVHRQTARMTPSQDGSGGTVVSWATYYANNLRQRDLDSRQKELMAQLAVPVLDMFDLSYEMAELYVDHVHCGAVGTFYMLDQLWPSPEHPYPYGVLV